MEIWVVAGATVVLLAIVLTVKNRMDAQKRENKIKQAFGTVPTGSAGKNAAHSFWKGYENSGKLPPKHIDALTWADLDMDEIFFRLNTSQSTVGDVWQYAALHLPAEEEKIKTRNKRVQCFEQEAELRLKTQVAFAKLGRRNMAELQTSAFDAGQMRFKNRTLYWILAFAPFIAIVLFFVSYQVAGLWLLFALMANFALTMMAKAKNAGNFYSVRYISGMLATGKKLAKLLQDVLPEDAQRLREQQKNFLSFRKSLRMLTFDQMVESTGLPNPTSLFLLPILSYAKLAETLVKKQEQMMELIELLGELELAICTASFRESLPDSYTEPDFVKDETIEMEGMYHPLLEEPVTNSAHFAKDVLITGSNASGKSTFIKAVAINCILAQTIGSCTAQGFALHPGMVVSSMAVEDNIIDGDSYFVAEIKSMKRLIQKAEAEYCYLFVDEILKGTNTIERVAASASVLHYLSGLPGVCMAATHDIELTQMLKEIYENKHFEETVEGQGVLFNYQLKDGPATGRNAIRLLSVLGFPQTITSKSNHLVQEFEETGLWGAL